jgi:hypothetical protein
MPIFSGEVLKLIPPIVNEPHVTYAIRCEAQALPMRWNISQSIYLTAYSVHTGRASELLEVETELAPSLSAI